MRKILKIAKLEFSLLFYSPIAWLVLTIFMLQSGSSFLENLQNIRTNIDLGYDSKWITATLFAKDGAGLFVKITEYLYLYLPLLTMGLMSRETSSGTIKLLLSSPVKIRQIILGKYLAIAGYGLTLIGIISLYVIIAAISVKNIDPGMAFSGLLSISLLIFTYSAIGLFMSCLTTYQVVAAISTLVVFALLQYVGTVGKGIDFIRDLTYFLSLSGRTETMINGMITTKDLFYYLIIIATFLALCMLRLKSERELKPVYVKTGRYVALICVTLLLGYVTSRPVLTGYLDMTANKSLTITKTSQDIAKKIKGELKVTTYVNMLARGIHFLLPEARNNDLSSLEGFKRFIPGLDVDYVYYYHAPADLDYSEYAHMQGVEKLSIDKIADQTALGMRMDRDLFMPPAEINKLINLKPEGYLSVRKLEYQGKSTFLRFYFIGEMNPYAGEAEIAAALNKLIVKAPKIVFVTGNNERSIDDKRDKSYLSMIAEKPRRAALINQGFDIDTIDLNHQNIPADASVVVLGDPTVPFTVTGQQKLVAYINNGGNMLITAEPGRQQVLNPLLQTLGVQLKPGTMVKPDKDLSPGFINTAYSAQSLGLDVNIEMLHGKDGNLRIKGAAAIVYGKSGGFQVEPLLLSPSGGWNKQQTDGLMANPVLPAGFASPGMVNQPLRGTPMIRMIPAGGMRIIGRPVRLAGAASANIAGKPHMMTPVIRRIGNGGMRTMDLSNSDLSFNAAAGDQKGVFPAMVSLKRKIGGKEQRIIVSGDADFMSNSELEGKLSFRNINYTQGLFRWLSNSKFPVDVSRLEGKDNDLSITNKQITGLMWLCRGIMPALIAAAGAIVLFRRRRK